MLAAFLVTSCAAGDDPAPAVVRTTPPPWDAPRDAVSHIDAAGMERLPFGHPVARTVRSRLDVVVDGEPVTVPAHVGIDRLRALEAALHTHRDDGELWVESPHPDEVATLGDFFVLWGVRLDEHCLGHRCEGDGAPGRLTVTADDRPVEGDPRGLELTEGLRITVAFGDADVPDGRAGGRGDRG